MKHKKIHDYTLKRFLGQGGMAEVWYAENVLGNPAAVKILLKEYSFNEQIVNRFEAEAKIMVKLKHPNIRKVISYGEVDERPAIIMEYLEGEDLSTKLNMRKLYTNDDLVHWWNQAVEALSHTHSKGIVHRDIKPSNLFITSEGDLKLLDFGIAKIKEGVTYTKTGQTMGTPLYMSPEQVKDSKHVDASTDAYSLAVSFVQLVSRQNPYGLMGEPSRFDIETAIVSQSVATEHLDQPWNTLLKNYLQKEATQRQKLSLYQEDEATQITTPEKTKIVPPPPPPKPKPQPTVQDTPPSSKKNKGIWIGVVALVLLLIGGIWWWQGGKEGSSPTPPVAERLDSLAYARLDKTNKDSIQHFIATYSQSAYVSDANTLLATINTQEQEAKQKAEAERKQKAKEEAERKRQEEAKRKAEQAEVERKQNAKVKYVKGVKFIKIPGKNFYMSETEVTIGQYLKFCKATNSHYPEWLQEGNGYNIYTGTNNYYKKVGMSERNTNYAITGVTWYDAVAYAKWLGGRLPTEQEWEYCADGGEDYTYAGSNSIDEVAWYYGNSGYRVHAVKGKKPNAYGLYDMSGNVGEWTSSKWSSSSSNRVLRGGSWGYDAKRCRSAYRYDNSPNFSINIYGFRLLLSTD